VTSLVVITHVDRAVVGLVDEIAEERRRVPRVIRPYRGEALPDPDGVDGVVVLGGPQSAYDDHRYLREEERFLADAVQADVPVLAICLGSQVLARALGGTAQPGETGLEAGVISVKPTDAASTDIVGEFFSFHSDSMTPPAGAEVLATSDRYVQAWTAGSALALQFHPEMTLAGVTGLLGVEGPKLERYGVDVDAVRREAQRYFAAGAEDSRVLLERWFDRLTPDRPATDTREE
jgi:GMP synthase (glutamine-hydrolysing)